MTLIRLLAAQTFTLGIALDALSSQVQAAIVKDVLALADEYDGEWRFTILVPRKFSPKLRPFLESFDSIREGQLTLSTYADGSPPKDVDVWCRYVVEEEVPLDHPAIYDRIVKVEHHEIDINTNLSYPIEPAYENSRPAPPLANPLDRPMPNPYAKSWLQFAKKTR